MGRTPEADGTPGNRVLMEIAEKEKERKKMLTIKPRPALDLFVYKG
jgi:hypothetical protein